MKKISMGLVFTLFTLMLATQSHAAVTWNWSIGSEAGTLTTNGTIADTLGPFTFTITNFTVSTSSIPGNIGGSWVGKQPPQTFDWDGTQPTQFTRGGGVFTNGSNFFGPDALGTPTNYSYGLQPPPTPSFLDDSGENTVVSAVLMLTVGTAEPQSVPIANSWVALLILLLLLTGGLYLRRQVRLHAH